MKNTKKIRVTKINKMNLNDIERRIEKLSGQNSSQYYKHLQSRKSELKN